MKILNLYSGLGGNRRLWKNVEVTAVENVPEIAAFYSDHFPKDEMVVGDAHEYLRQNFKDFDFIWSSPPCQSHASFRKNICVRFRGTEPVYPDLKLYEEILFLQYHAKCLWVVENVKPYYPPLIEGQLIQRHLFWSNFPIEDKEFEKDNIRTVQIPQLQEKHGFNLDGYQIPNKRQVLRNCVLPELGNHILKCARQSL